MKPPSQLETAILPECPSHRRVTVKRRYLLLLVGSAMLFAAHQAPAQGTAFTYQGRLGNSGSPATGIYDLRFTIYDSTNFPGTLVAGPLTNAATSVSNGLFDVTLDFGSGVFTGPNRWLELGVRTNGGGSFTMLSPRQQLTPSPYAIFANTSSNLSGTVSAAQLSGTVGNGQLANSSITINAGSGLSGGGAVALGGSTTLNNAGVLSVAGNADITVSTLGGAVTLGDTATSTDTAGTIVKRDAGGSFSTASITLDGNLNLPATTATAGIIYSGTGTMVHDYGTQNFFGGPSAGNLALTGNGNTGLGYLALSSVVDGSGNTASGAYALNFNTSGTHNTANGYHALYDNTTGSENTAVGRAALHNNTTGIQNTANGVQALNSNTNGNYNVANGYDALYYNTSGSDNTANGFQALLFNTSGYNNAANGYQALLSNTGGYENTANGFQALYSNTSGSDNTANGFTALLNLTNGNYNTATGMDALRTLLSGDNNTADGVYSLGLLTVGNHNIGLGYEAGLNVASGTNNIEIGNLGAGSDNRTIRLGDSQTNTFIAGIYDGTATAAQVYVNANGKLGIFTSSRRYKDYIQTMGETSAALYALKPVTFKYKPGIDPAGVPQFGLVAEEVNQVDPDLVVHDEQHGIYTVRYEAVNVMLLNEFLKEHRQVQAQELEIGKQKTDLQELRQTVNELKELLNQMTSKKAQ